MYDVCVERGDIIISLFRNITKRQWTLIFLTIILIISAYFLLPISVPLIIALLTALALNPAVRFTQQKMKLSRKSAVITVFLLFLLVIGFAGTFIVTRAVGQIAIFVEDMPRHFNELNAFYAEWERGFQQYTSSLPPEFIQEITGSLDDYMTKLTDTAKEKITIERIADVFAKVPQYLISFIVYLIALFLFMLELPALKSKIYHSFTKETAEKVTYMNARLTDVIVGFLKAQFLVSIIIFIVSLIGLFIIAPKVAILMSVVIWIIDLIPIIGSIVILGPWSLFMFLSGDISLGIQLAVLAVILLTIRRTIEPKVMGQHIGLSPLATLIAMFLGLKLFGILGFIIGPIVVIAFTSAKEAGILKWKVKI